jgi:hypothetical protein
MIIQLDYCHIICQVQPTKLQETASDIIIDGIGSVSHYFHISENREPVSATLILYVPGILLAPTMGLDVQTIHQIVSTP